MDTATIRTVRVTDMEPAVGGKPDTSQAPVRAGKRVVGWLGTRKGEWTLRIVTLVVILVSWQLYAGTVSRALLAGPIEISQSMYKLIIQDDVILDAAMVSLGALIAGLGLAIVLGITVGVLMGRYPLLERVLDPYVSFFNALPSIVLIPLLLVWLGLGFQLRVVLVILACVFPVIINTLVGVKEVPVSLLEVGKVHCVSERQALLTIIFPSAIPFIFTGVRQALSQALVMVVVAEILVAVTGLGGLMVTYGNYYRTADLFVPLFVIMAGSLLLTGGLRRLERRLTPWHDA